MSHGIEKMVADAKDLVTADPTTDQDEVQHRIKVLANAVVALAEAIRELERKTSRLGA
jgi:hypothetical protein